MVVQFYCVVLEAAPGVVYPLFDFGGQVGVVIYVPPEVYKMMSLLVYLASCLNVECGGGNNGHSHRSRTHYLSLDFQEG